jgi:hypothetical protein
LICSAIALGSHAAGLIAQTPLGSERDDIAVPGTSDWNRHSFLSGHAANSMACASFMSHRFSLGVAEPVMYTYVSAIGLGRMLDGRRSTI